MILDEFLFLDESSGAESNVYNVSQGEQLTIQVSVLDEEISGEELSIYVVGRTDLESDFCGVATIDTYDMLVYIAEQPVAYPDIYIVSISGLKQIKIINEDEDQFGKVKVYGVIS